MHTVDVRAIVLIGGRGETAETEPEIFANQPLAFCEVLGQAALGRMVDWLRAQGINAVSIVSHWPSPQDGSRPAATWTDAGNGQFWRAAENVFSEMAQSGAEAVLVIRMGGYAEFTVDDFLQRHLDGRAHVTRAVHRDGLPLDMFVITASRRNDAAFLFRHRLQQTRSECGTWNFEGYYNALASAGDLRELAVDGLMQRVHIKPAGEERRPGVWAGRGAQIHRQARVLAPAYIGEHARIRAGAVITRCGTVEHHAEIDCGTVVENATVLPYSYIGPGLDITHAVAGANKLLHLPRNVEVEISDPRLMDVRSQYAPLRALNSAASLAAFLPVQLLRGLFAKSHREPPSELPAAVAAPSPALQSSAGFESSAEASSFPAHLVVARRYGNQ